MKTSNLLMVFCLLVLSAAIGTQILGQGFLPIRAEESAEKPVEPKKTFGSEVTVLNGEVRAAVELTRVSGSSINAPVIESAGTEYDENSGPLRPGRSYYAWVVGTNYLPHPQVRRIEVWVEGEDDTPIWVWGRYRGEDGATESITASVSELVTDAVTIYEFTKTGWVVDYILRRVNEPVTFEGGEAKIFLVRFKLEDRMPEGTWTFSLRLR